MKNDLNEKNRRIIATVSFMRRFISIFFNLFFNIYVLKIVNDLGFVIKVNLISLVFGLIFNTLILKYLNNKNVKYIYNSSFIILVICVGMLLFLKEDIIKYIYLFKMLYTFEEGAYYGPHEMIIMGSNNHKTFSSFQANMSILTNIATILTPIFSGFIIEKFSYNTLFVILILEAIIVILTASKITSFYIEDKKTNIREFWNKVKKYPHMNDIYKCMFYRRVSAQGAITDLLPIILFLKLNSELNVGTYSSIFAVITIFSLLLLKYTNKKNIKKKFYIPFAILTFLSTLFLIFIPSFTTIIIYYIFMNSVAAVIETESTSAVYEAINNEELSKYNREHDIIFNIYMFFGQVISYSLTYILYTRFYNANILSVVVSILMFFLIMSCIYLQKVENYFFNKANKGGKIYEDFKL